jgi:hypothetical protein
MAITFIASPSRTPTRRSSDVEVELVNPRVAAVPSELDLQLFLVGAHRKVAHRARSPDVRAAPGAVRGVVRKLAISHGGACLLTQHLFVGHG